MTDLPPGVAEWVTRGFIAGFVCGAAFVMGLLYLCLSKRLKRQERPKNPWDD